MLTVYELTREQMKDLKAAYLDRFLQEEENRCASYGELADADEIVTDDEIFSEYAGTMFSPDDFLS